VKYSKLLNTVAGEIKMDVLLSDEPKSESAVLGRTVQFKDREGSNI
jgi:hypothetical protein